MKARRFSLLSVTYLSDDDEKVLFEGELVASVESRVDLD